MSVSEKSRAASAALVRLVAALETDGDRGLLTRLADELDQAVFVVDADQSILLFNRRAEAITGFSRSEVLGRHCLSGFRCGTCLEACSIKRLKEIRDIPLELYRGDGSVVHVNKSAIALSRADGSFAGAIEIFHEMPSDGAEDTKLPGDWDTVDAMMQPLGRSAVLLDGSFRLLEVSRWLVDLVGWTDTPWGRPATDLFGPELLAETSPFRISLLSGERVEGWRASILAEDGTPRAVSITGARLGASTEANRFLLMIRPESTDPAAVDNGATEFEGMTARSPRMKRIFQLVDHLHDSDATVLITGESGTGKELVARAVHARSPRAPHPFVAVNCGALPEGLLESELFGHVRGAFTGAVRDKVGRFEAAGTGTVFLDEVAELPLPLQVKLLRVLQERTFERVGDTETRPFSARIVAATNRDLARLVTERHFRDDLFYRLKVVPIELPPLRERREDLEVLIHTLLAKIGRRQSRARRLSPAAMRALLSYHWPGNVRQLENALEYAMAVCEGQTIHREDLPVELAQAPPAPVEAGLSTEPPDTPPPGDPHVSQDATPPATPSIGPYPSLDRILEALTACRNRRGEAAKQLGISRTTLWRRMKEEGLTGPRGREHG